MSNSKFCPNPAQTIIALRLCFIIYSKKYKFNCPNMKYSIVNKTS